MTHKSERNVVVVNTTFPHLQANAIDLAMAGRLKRYYHALLVSPQISRRLEPRRSAVARRLTARMRPRFAPAEIQSDLVRCPAWKLELVRIGASAIGQKIGSPAVRANQTLIRMRNANISQAVRSDIDENTIVLSSYTSAVAAFTTASRVGAVSVLDYPTAHHDYMREMRSKAVVEWPEWKDTWTDITDVTIRTMLDDECSLADHIVVASRFARSTFPHHLQAKVAVCPYKLAPIDWELPDTDATQRPDSRLKVLFVGQMSLRKGLPVLLKAVSELGNVGVTCHLIGPLVGNSNWLNDLPDNVTYWGQIPRNSLIHHYRSASVLVLPSYVEGQPNVVLEALSHGLPVITTPTGGHELISDGQTGAITPTGNVQALKSVLESLALEPQRIAYWREQSVHGRKAGPRAEFTLLELMDREWIR